MISDLLAEASRCGILRRLLQHHRVPANAVSRHCQHQRHQRQRQQLRVRSTTGSTRGACRRPTGILRTEWYLSATAIRTPCIKTA